MHGVSLDGSHTQQYMLLPPPHISRSLGREKKKITKNYPTAVLLTGLLIVISEFCFYFVAGQNPSLRKDMEAFKGLGYTVQLD